MLRLIKRHKKFVFLFVFLSIWMTLLVFVSPSELVEIVGVETGYLMVFLTAIVGVSSLTSGSFYAVILTLASTGEFNPFLLALVAAPAMTFGDTIFFLFSSRGRLIIKEKAKRRIRRLVSWTENFSEKKIFLVTYFYSGFTPFPQDILMMTLGVGGASLRTVMGAVLLGNATFIIITASAVMYLAN